MFDGGHTNKYSQLTGQNLAPVEPLKHLADSKDKVNEHSTLNQVIKEFHDTITNKDLEARKEIAEVGRIMANVRSGKLIMKRDPIHGGLALLKPLPQKSRKDRHVYPLAQVNSSQLTAMWTLSRPQAKPRHFGSTNKAQIQHNLIETLIGHYDAEMFDEWFHQSEALSMMDYGCSVIRMFYDEKLNSVSNLKPLIQDKKETLFEGYGFCRSCGHEGKDDDFLQTEAMPRCKECGGYDVSDIVPKQIANVSEIVGAEMQTQGDLGAELLPVPACNWDMRHLVHHSPYFQYRSEVPTRLINDLLGVELEADGDSTDFGLEIINSLATRGGSVENQGRNNSFGHRTIDTDKSVMHEEWYKPEFYTGIKLDKDEKTVSGEVIPKGVPLEKLFPDAMCVVGFDEMNLIANVYNEKPTIASGVYHIQSFSGVGKGTSDSIEISENLNMSHSAALASLKRHGAGGGIAYDSDALTKTQVREMLKPSGLVPVKMRGTDYRNVSEAIHKIQFDGMSQSNLAYIAQLTNLLNISFQTTEFTGGTLNNVDVNTATGQQMLEAQNQQRSAAPLRMKGYLRTICAAMIIDLYKQYITIPRFFGSDDKFSMAKGRYIKSDQLPENIKFDFVADSEMPQNTFTKRQKSAEMLEKSQYFGVPFAQLMEMNPRIASWWAGQYGSDIPLFNHHELLVVCEDRIADIKEIAQEAEQLAQMSGIFADPTMLAEQVLNGLKRPLSISEENHQLKSQILSEYLDDDEVLEWSPLVRASVEALIAKHLQLNRDAQLRVMALEQEGQLSLQQNQMAAEQAMMPPPPDPNEELGQEMLTGMTEKMVEEAQKDEDFGRNEEKAANDHQRAIELEQLRSQGRPTK